MTTLSTTTTIDASPRTVWATLTSFELYHEWSERIQGIEGQARVGAKLAIRQQARPRRFTARVIEAVDEHRLVWRAGIPWVFTGEHAFVLEPEGPSVRLEQRESFRGLAVRIFGAPRGWEHNFATFGEALRRRAENVAARR